MVIPCLGPTSFAVSFGDVGRLKTADQGSGGLNRTQSFVLIVAFPLGHDV
jgi:hypothetical protein